jgi:hypothetical protein
VSVAHISLLEGIVDMPFDVGQASTRSPPTDSFEARLFINNPCLLRITLECSWNFPGFYGWMVSLICFLMLGKHPLGLHPLSFEARLVINNPNLLKFTLEWSCRVPGFYG